MITKLFLSFFEISLSISLIVAALLLLAPFFNKRYAAKWKYFIWIFIALRLLIPLNSEEKPTDASTDAAMTSRRVFIEIPEQMTSPIAMQSEKSNVSITLLDMAAFVWMTGSLIFISLHLISYLHYKRQVMKKGTIIKDTHILCQLFKLKHELHVKRTIYAVEYSEADSPMIIGFLNPVLVLPKEQYSSEELFFILKHELVHLKRGDVYFKLLFASANAIHWFNPLIWIMQKEASVDMELSCDERVTQGANYTVRKAYTETLLSTLHKQYAKRTVLSTQFYGGKQIMKRRFKNILLKYGKKNGISILICAVILTISFGTLVGCSMAKENSPENNLLINTTTSAPSETEAEKEDGILLQVMKEGKQILNSDFEDAGALAESSDIQEIRSIIDEFAISYFSGNADALQKLLAETYEGDIDTYEGSSTASDFTVKGLSDINEQNAGNMKEVWLEFMDSNEDSYTYLTFLFVKQDDDWKIESYGLEK